MKTSLSSRRTFIVAGTAIAAAPFLQGESLSGSSADTAAAKEFLVKWERAWNHHDAHQLSLLQTSDANTVNRFGTLVQGRAAVEKALGFLHNPADRIMASPRRPCS
jgi:hypothetical protein